MQHKQTENAAPQMLVEGCTVPTDRPAAICRRLRLYGARRAVRLPDKSVRPVGAWEFIRELEIAVGGDSLTIPDFALGHTGAGGWALYRLVFVAADGRETEHLVELPPAAAGRFGPRIRFATLLLYNLEMQGVIEPGQLEG
ncbi:MAG TPA: hypothetical protein VF546_13965 [Pyrinomonadaceae bacterium]